MLLMSLGVLASLTLVIGSIFFTLNNGYLLDSFIFSFLFGHVRWFVFFSFFYFLSPVLFVDLIFVKPKENSKFSKMTK